MRVVQLSTFAEACGIATVMSPHRAVAPERETRLEPVRLWSRNRGTIAEAAEVLQALAALRPDLVHLQINAGLFSPEFVAALTAGLRQQRLPCVATLHDRQPPSLIARIRHHALLLALGDAALVVHNPAHAAELSARAPTIIPHGVTGPTGEVPVAERAPDGTFVIAHFGFLLRDKGIGDMIEAVAALRSRGDVRLRYHVLGAISDSEASRATYRDLVRLVRSHQLTETVRLDPSFATLDDSLRALRRADWIVLNYQSGSAQGTSGAVRHALASGRPVAVSQAAIFDDVREAVHTLHGPLPDALAALMQAPELAARTQARARVFREAHAWERVARLHRELYERHLARTKNG